MMNTIIALDIGAQTIKAAMADRNEDGLLEILATATTKSRGFVNGGVQDMNEISESISNVIENLQENSEFDIDPFEMPIFYSVSGENLSSKNIETEMRRIGNIDQDTEIGKVSQNDINRQMKDLETFASNFTDKNMQKIAIIPQCYQIDDEVGIKNPKDMHGQEIRAAGFFITDNLSHILDLEGAIEKALSQCFECDITKSDLKLVPVVSSIASAMAILNDDYDEIGVAVLDIGKDCCDLAVYYKRYPILIWSKKFAGDEITKEIKKFLTIPLDEAEKIKKEYACATPQKTGKKENIEVSGNRTVSLELLAQWVHEPVKNIFENVNNVLDSIFDGTTYKNNISQIVLTGGTANLKEIAFVAQEVLQLPVKTVKPNAVKVSDDFKQMNEDMTLSTLMGLCIYGTQDNNFESGNKKRKRANSSKTKNKSKFSETIKNTWSEIIEFGKNIKFN